MKDLKLSFVNVLIYLFIKLKFEPTTFFTCSFKIMSLVNDLSHQNKSEKHYIQTVYLTTEHHFWNFLSKCQINDPKDFKTLFYAVLLCVFALTTLICVEKLSYLKKKQSKKLNGTVIKSYIMLLWLLLIVEGLSKAIHYFQTLSATNFWPLQPRYGISRLCLWLKTLSRLWIFGR